MTTPRAIRIRGNLAEWHRLMVFDADGSPIPNVKKAVVTVKAKERTKAMLTFRDGSDQWCELLPSEEKNTDLADFLRAVQTFRSQVRLASHARSPGTAHAILHEPATRDAGMTIERLLPSVGAGS